MTIDDAIERIVHPGPYWALGPFTRIEESLLRPKMDDLDLQGVRPKERPAAVMEAAGLRAIEFLNGKGVRSRMHASGEYATSVYLGKRIAMCARQGIGSFSSYYVGKWEHVDELKGGMILLMSSRGVYGWKPKGYVTQIMEEKTKRSMGESDARDFVSGFYHAKRSSIGAGHARYALSNIGIELQ
jgi:hypothetical protein